MKHASLPEVVKVLLWQPRISNRK